MEIFLKFSGPSPLAEMIEYNPEKEPLFEFLRREINCELVETVRFRGLPDWLLGIVDEEGLYRRPKEQNAIGTLLYGGMIVGPLIIGSRGFRDGEPDLVGFGDFLEARKAYDTIFKAVFGGETHA